MFPTRRAWLRASCLVGLAAGCTVDSDDGQVTFGSSPSTFTATAASATVASASATTDADGSTGEATGDASGSSSDGEGGITSTSAATSAESTGGEIEQPETGMYSHCVDTAQCTSLNICVLVQAGDGFCSTTPCNDPTICAASPGGTATPFCADVMDGAMMRSACALDCSAGKTCPGGMLCVPLGAAMVCT